MIKYFDIFAGIGGFRSGLEKAGGFECVGYCEIDRYAKKAYETMTIRKARCITMTQEKSTQTSYPISTLYAEASLAKAFQSLEKGADLTTQEELCSLKLPESLPLKNLNICCLRTYPDCYRMTQAGRLRPSLVRWTNWGTMSHGRCLTAQILESPNPEKECSLSDFLEKNAPEKYCLSRTQIQKLLYNAYPDERAAECTQPTD